MKKNWLTISLSFFAFVLPWQIKLILRNGEINGGQNNFLEIALFAFGLAALFFVFLAFRQMIIKKKWPEKNSKPNIFLLIFVLSLFFSIFFGADYSLSFSHFFYFFTGAALLFFAQLFQKEINWRLVVKAFLFSCFLSALLGIFQFTIQEVPEIKYLVAPHQVSEYAGESVLENNGQRLLRAYGGFDHPNIFGGVMVIALLLIIDKLIKAKDRKEWLASVFIFIIFFWALLISFSRAAWLAFAVTLLIYLFFNFRRNLVKILLIFGLSAGLSMIFFGANSEWFSSRMSASGRLESISIEERWTGLKIASEKITSQTFQPAGLGNYANFLLNKYSDLSAWQYQPVHNVWLLLSAETGFWSAIFLFLFCLSIIFNHKKKSAITISLLAVLFVLSLFDHWLFSLPFGVLFSFFVLSLSFRETIL